MADAISTGLAVVAVVLIAIGLIALSVGNLTAAGMSFLSTSLVIYLRESRGTNGSSA